MSAQHTPGPWEKDQDSDGRWMVCAGPDTTICRGIKNEADADLIVTAINCLLKPPKDAWEVSGQLAAAMAKGIDFDRFISATSAQRDQMLREQRRIEAKAGQWQCERIGQARSLRPCWYVFREFADGSVEYLNRPSGPRRKFFSEASARAAISRATGSAA